MCYKRFWIVEIDLLDSYCWAIFLGVELFQLRYEHNIDSILGSLELACANNVNFGVAEEPGWFSFNFNNSVMYSLRPVQDPGRSAILHPTGPGRY